MISWNEKRFGVAKSCRLHVLRAIIMLIAVLNTMQPTFAFQRA